MKKFGFSSLLLWSCTLFSSDNFVVGKFSGQLGNNLFQVATASALAWDNDGEAYFPELSHMVGIRQHMFSRCKIFPPKKEIQFEWFEPSYAYHPIPFHPQMSTQGYFQSEKYFAHHRKKLLKLFAPNERDLKYIQSKYQEILDHPNTVGVQIRYYFEDPAGNMYVQYGKDYLEKAMSLFPDSALFVISSNNLEFARKNIPASAKNVLFLEGEPYYIDFHILTLCKHNIISNSSFGWWTAWLNQNPHKIVVRPPIWAYGLPCQDVCPDHWIIIDCKKGYINDPTSY